MEITNVDGTFAAEVRALDISADDLESHADALRAAIDEHGVLIIRESSQDDDAYLRFAALFGELQHSTAKLRDPASDKDDRLVDISNVKDDGTIAASDSIQRTIGLGARLWHTDNSFRNPPTRYTMLAARTIASSGGDTQFRDMRAAFEALPAARRQELEELVAIHDFEHSRRASNGPPMSDTERASLPPVEHPLIRTHPTTGRKAIYTGSHACRIIGVSDENAARTLAELDEAANGAEFAYTHKWQAGDILIWDNRSVQHRQMPWDDDHVKRVMRRATIADQPTRIPATA